MNIDDKLSQIFEIQPMSKSEIVENEKPLSNDNSALTHDYETTRANLHAILNQGSDALMHALDVAKQSEHPRAFEVVGGLMKHLSDINHQLLDLHKKKQSLDNNNSNETPTSGPITNNAIFVGSTTELSKMLGDIRKGK